MPFGKTQGRTSYTVGTNATTPQTMQATPEQILNNAGGYVFEISPWMHLERFAVMGITDNTYYTDKEVNFVEARRTIEKCLALDPYRMVDMVVDISETGRGIRNISCIYAYSVAVADPRVEVRKYALDRLERICRIGTHLFLLDKFLTHKLPGKGFKRPQRGWSSMLRKAISRWYNNKNIEKLGFQVAKYQSREGSDHKHLIRCSHLFGPTDEHNNLYRWILDNPEKYPYDINMLPEIVRTKIALERVDTLKDVLTILRETNAPEEFIPGQWKQHDEVWREMLPNLGIEAIFRNLCNLANRGALTRAQVKWLIEERLTRIGIEKSRLHPIKMLLAYGMYLDGHRRQRNGNVQQWTVDGSLKKHLGQCFTWGFKNVEPMGIKTYVGLDVSGSMGMGSIYEGVEWLNPRVASSAVLSVLLNTEETVKVRGFSHELIDLPVKKGMELDKVVRRISGLPFGATDCALPMLDAMKNKDFYDLFVVITDNETYYGKVHPFEALKRYRNKVNPNAKLLVLSCLPSRFSIADPSDPGMLDVCGFDANFYGLMRNFALEGR